MQAGGRIATQSSKRYSYTHIPADRFYQSALASIDSNPRQHLYRGVRVDGVTGTQGAYSVDSSEGRLTARLVFDARPATYARPPRTPPMPASGLVQRFVGWHIRTQRPVFDASTVDLMNFQPVVADGRILFFYVLPFAVDEAMVEATCLEWSGLPASDLQDDLRTYLLQTTGGDPYEILFREAGALPMQAAPPARGLGYSIGIRGGRLKPSSGYAFLRIQRQSRSLAHALAAGVPLPRAFEQRHYGLLDRVFLQALRRDPQSAPEYFLRMFDRVPADRLVRFLSEAGTPAESLQVALALPRMPFISAAFAEAGLRS